MSVKINKLTFEQAVRKRPGMYLGSNGGRGVINLLCGLIKDIIDVCETDKIFFSIIISDEEKYSLLFKTNNDTSSVIQQFYNWQKSKLLNHMKVLPAVTDKFELSEDANGVMVNFHLDKSVFIDAKVDYHHLMEELTALALLNRGTEILVQDTTQNFHNQKYLSFPEGVFYLYERSKGDAIGKLEFELLFDEEYQTNKFQFALAYRKDKIQSPKIVSFANDVFTKCNGSLVDGILDGLIAACKKYVLENNLMKHQIRRRKFYNGLILICSVRGNDFYFEGSFKEALATKEVRTQAKRITFILVGNYLNSDNKKAAKFLRRFDDT